MPNYTTHFQSSLPEIQEIERNLFNGLDKGQTLTAQTNIHAILKILIKRAKKDNKVTIGHRQLATESGLDKRTIQKWMKRLIKQGLITVESQGFCKVTKQGGRKLVTPVSSASYLLARVTRSIYSRLDAARQQQFDSFSNSSCLNQNEKKNEENILYADETKFRGSSERVTRLDDKKSYLALDDLPDSPLGGAAECGYVDPIQEALSKSLDRWRALTPAEKDAEKRSHAKQRRAKEREKNAKAGAEFVKALWEQIKDGRARYPVHPETLRYQRLDCYEQLDADREFDRANGFPWYNYFLNDPDNPKNLFPKVSPSYRNLKQPPLEDRPRCKKCGRSMYLVFLQSPFGAIKYICRNTRKVAHTSQEVFQDVWQSFPVLQYIIKKKEEPLPVVKVKSVKPVKLEEQVLALLKSRGLEFTRRWLTIYKSKEEASALMVSAIRKCDFETRQVIKRAGAQKELAASYHG